MTRNSKARGFGLVELMVAVAIGTIVMLVVYQLFTAAEATRRTSVAGSDAQMNAAIAVNVLQDEVRNAGYGLFGIGSANARLLGCNVSAYSATTGNFFSFQLAPVSIVQGADNNGNGVGQLSDTITVVYSDLAYPSVPSLLLASMTASTNDIQVADRFGIAPGNLFIVSESVATTTPPQPLPAAPSPPIFCALGEATGTPGGVGQLATVQHNPGQYRSNGVWVNVQYNGPSGIGASAANPTGVQFSTNATVYNFGFNPSVVTFSLNNNQLMTNNLLSTAGPQVLVGNVVQLQALYGVGIDTDGDGLADQLTGWQTVAPANLGLVMAVRFAVLTQSSQVEKPNQTTGLCNATPVTSPELTYFNDLNGGAGYQFNVANIVNWQCYRYKKFEAVVPLRNLIWNPNA